MGNPKETLPIPPVEGPIPKMTTHPSLENLFAELFSSTNAPATDVCYDPIAIPSPVPYPSDIPMLPSSFRHPPQDQHSIQENIPAGIQNFSSLMAHDTNVIFPPASETPGNLPLVDRHSGATSSPELTQLEDPYSPLPEPSFNLNFPENLPDSEAKGDGNQQENSMETVPENHSPLIKGLTESSPLSTPQFSQLPQPYSIPQNQGVTLTRTVGQVSNFLPFQKSGCARNQDNLNASHTEIPILSPRFHIRPYDEKSERPRKRQRRTEGTEMMKSINSETSPPRMFSSPSPQVDQIDIHECVHNGNQGQILTMPVIDDAAIQRNLVTDDIEYQSKNTTGDTTMEQGASALNIDTDFSRGKNPAYNSLFQSVHRPGAFETRRSPDSIQTPGNHISNVNGEQNLNSEQASKLLCCSLLPTEAIADTSSARGSKRRVNSDCHDSRSTPLIAGVSEIKLDIPRTSAVDTETSSDACVFNASTRNQELPEISRPQLPEVSESKTDSKEVQDIEEEAMEPSGTVPRELQRDEVHYGTHYILMRLENPPQCNMCKKLYITEENLKKHMKTAHRAPRSNKHKCGECKGIFMNETNLRRHIYDTHRTKNYFCDPCRAGFTKKRALVLHEKEVHGVVPTSVQKKKKAKQSRASTNKKKVLNYFECLLCMYSTPVKGNLMRHVKGKHLNERPHKCPYCDRSAKTKQNIDFHIQVCRNRPDDETGGTQDLRSSPQSDQSERSSSECSEMQ